jgi:hypothetical protein
LNRSQNISGFSKERRALIPLSVDRESPINFNLAQQSRQRSDETSRYISSDGLSGPLDERRQNRAHRASGGQLKLARVSFAGTFMGVFEVSKFITVGCKGLFMEMNPCFATISGDVLE